MADDTNTAERITDEMVHAALKAKNPTLYRDHLRHPSNGPVLSASTENEIQVTRKMLEAAFQAGRASLAASAGSEPVAWCQPDDSNAGEAFSWPGTDKRAHHTTPLYLRPSPPDGMAGWRQGVEAVAAMLTKKADDFAKEHGHDDMGGLSFGRGAHADAKLDYHSGLLELADEVREMRSEATPELSSDNRVLMEHSGCGRGTQIDTLTVRLNPGDKVILCSGTVTRASITAPPLPASEAK